MNRCHVLTLAGAVLTGLCFGAGAAAGEMKVELDSAKDTKLFSSRFTRYGYNPMKTIATDLKGGVRFVLPSATKDVGQTGLYSFFAVAGDFEMALSFDWTNVTAPREGYGARCGIELEVEGSPTPMTLSFQRTHLADKRGEGYLVVRGVLNPEKKLDYTDEHFEPSKAKKGKLALRRENDELVCLAANNLKEELRELCRIPFTKTTIRKTRLFADQGTSPTFLDTKITAFRVQAEEITGGIPLRDQKFAWGWWLIFAGFLVVGSILFILYRREKRAEDEEDEPAPAKRPPPRRR
ncbi:MAG: hypothetical protein L0Y71_20665 [Gemmataceae bacterium]|nr:hypothetical protein [Gemmataceae bacterium]